MYISRRRRRRNRIKKWKSARERRQGKEGRPNLPQSEDSGGERERERRREERVNTDSADSADAQTVHSTLPYSSVQIGVPFLPSFLLRPSFLRYTELGLVRWAQKGIRKSHHHRMRSLGARAPSRTGRTDGAAASVCVCVCVCERERCD